MARCNGNNEGGPSVDGSFAENSMCIRVLNPHACAVILTSCMMFQFAPRATAQVSIGIRLPSASIGINVPLYPDLVPVPGYPVYYDPRLHSNLFFYDGLYWVYAEDN